MIGALFAHVMRARPDDISRAPSRQTSRRQRSRSERVDPVGQRLLILIVGCIVALCASP